MQSSSPTAAAYPTQGSVVTAFNVIRAKPTPDVRGYFELLYAETDAQQKFLSTKDGKALVQDLATALQTRFNAPLIPAEPDRIYP
ncbi:MAG: hypothetical protein SGJ11_09895 [Phycisphaerae bacterium]|nr:hypothetical protein [Phycisphaerae bacterium]